MAKYDVFISYSRKDSSVANEICEALAKAGITFFIDRKGISGGMEFPLVLANAICDSKIFLFLASENSYASKFTNNEITFAFNEKPKESILPYIIDGSSLPLHIRFIFAGINWRNRFEHPINPVLISDLNSLLGNNKKGKQESKQKIITPAHVESIGKVIGQLNLLPSVLHDIICTKNRYKAAIKIEAYEKIPNKGVAIIGKVCYGEIQSGGRYIAGPFSKKGVQGHDIMFWNISKTDIGKSKSFVEIMKKNCGFQSDYECYLASFTSRYDPKGYGLHATPGDIVGIVLSGFTPHHLDGITHLFRI